MNFFMPQFANHLFDRVPRNIGQGLIDIMRNTIRPGIEDTDRRITGQSFEKAIIFVFDGENVWNWTCPRLWINRPLYIVHGYQIR